MSEQSLGNDFVGIPCKTLDSKQWKGLQPTTRCLYLTVLKRYYRNGKLANGMVTWTYDDLASEAGLSRRTVRRGMQELKQKDWVAVWEPGGRWERGTTYLVNPFYANGTTPKGSK